MSIMSTIIHYVYCGGVPPVYYVTGGQILKNIESKIFSEDTKEIKVCYKAKDWVLKLLADICTSTNHTLLCISMQSELICIILSLLTHFVIS